MLYCLCLEFVFRYWVRRIINSMYCYYHFPSLISLMVSVDVKHHVLLLSLGNPNAQKGKEKTLLWNCETGITCVRHCFTLIK